MIDGDLWKGKSVLVTGHTGFKGSWLSIWLEQLGARVVGVALPPSTKPSLYEDANLANYVQSSEHDIRDVAFLEQLIVDHDVEAVFHLAAQALVLPSYNDPLDTFSINVLGTAAVLEAVRRTRRPRACVIITSDKCYENREWVWPYREDDPLGGHDPYSASKGCAEIVTSSYRRSFFIEGTTGLASARAGNVIGGGDWSKHRLIPDIVRALDSNSELRVRNAAAIRPWQHVLEPISGYLLLAQRLFQGDEVAAQSWNFGPDTSNERDVAWMIERFQLAWGDGVTMIHTNASAHEARYLSLDSSKSRRILGWKPALGIEETIEWTARWYKRYLEGISARELCMADIIEFTRRG